MSIFSSDKIKYFAIALILIIVAVFLFNQYSLEIYSAFSSRGINSKGGDITIVNAKIWTGDSNSPWRESISVRDGKIISLDSGEKIGRIIDAKGKLLVPGFYDSHTHPHVPFILVSPEDPTLFDVKSVEEVQERLRKYVKEHPEDKYPRMFGWMDVIFKDGEKPNRHMLDKIVSDKPVYLVHHSGHNFWANTKALELVGVLEKDPENVIGYIERDENGIATGYTEETEYAATDGLFLRTVKKVKPLKFQEEVLILRFILEEYSKVGVISIWTKDGDIHVSELYEELLKQDSLPVRSKLDILYTPYSNKTDFEKFSNRAKEIENANIPKNFLRANGVKLIMDLVEYHSWFFDPFADRLDSTGKSTFSMKEFYEQVEIFDNLGLHVNVLGIEDRAIHELLNAFEKLERKKPGKDRRFTIEHSEFITNDDLPRYNELKIIPILNPINFYPDEEYQKGVEKMMGKERLDTKYHRYRDLVDSGAIVVNGSDFPLATMDPLLGIHLLVNGTDSEGNPKGGIWPHKRITTKEALETYTVNAVYANFDEKHLGMLKEGYLADFVILSNNILDENFDSQKILETKVNLTVMNGHVLYEDFTSKNKDVQVVG